jgi:hypothetical protein
VPDTVTMRWLPHDYSWESAGADDGGLLGDRGRVLVKWPEELLGLVTACRLRGVRLVFEPETTGSGGGDREAVRPGETHAGGGPRRPDPRENGISDEEFDIFLAEIKRNTAS